METTTIMKLDTTVDNPQLVDFIVNSVSTDTTKINEIPSETTKKRKQNQLDESVVLNYNEITNSKTTNENNRRMNKG